MVNRALQGRLFHVSEQAGMVYSSCRSGIEDKYRLERRPAMAAKSKWLVLVCLIGLLVVTSSAGVPQLKLYDNFSAKHFDPSKWIGEPASIVGGSDKDRREVTVELAGAGAARHLHIAQTSYADVTDNEGVNGSGFGLGFADPSKVTAVAFTLVVNQEESAGCANNAASEDVGFFGDYFNPTGAQDGQTGDVVASIGASRSSSTTSADSGNSLDVNGSISQCVDSKCNNQTTLAFEDFGPVQPGSANTLSVSWDQPNHQFIFRVNNNPPVPVKYTVSDSFPPGLADRSFFVFGSVPHCTTMPRPFASIDASFDNVYVNR